MKITILDDYQNVIEHLNCFRLLEGRNVEVLHHSEKDPARLAKILTDTQIVVLTRERTEINEDLLARLPNLRLISQTGKISNHLDLAACTRHGVAVAEGMGSPFAPAELAWALLMNTVRKIPQAMEGMKQGRWQTNIGSAVHSKVIGIWGYGKIGRRMARYAAAFDAKVWVWGSEASRNQAIADGFEAAESKAHFFKNADIVTLHLRLNAQTRGAVKLADLRSMKPGACLINTARAELLEPGALREFIRLRKDVSIGLDVFEEEPIFDPEYDLFQLPNVVCTPHLGYVEQNGYELYFEKAFENVVNFLEGRPTHIVNPEVC